MILSLRNPGNDGGMELRSSASPFLSTVNLPCTPTIDNGRFYRYYLADYRRGEAA